MEITTIERCAVYNGAFGSGFDQLFDSVPTSGPPLAKGGVIPQFLDTPPPFVTGA